MIARASIRLVATVAVASITLMLLSACSSGSRAPVSGVDPATPDSGCAGSCADMATSLSVADVELVIAQAVAEAQARSVSASIAVVDRVGNVLAVFRMVGASPSVTIRSSDAAIDGGLEGVNIAPDSLAAIAKAISAAYLSTEGNAFTTRTASQIVQDHFNPRDNQQPGGPLFGVQFSQLPCSDLLARFAGGAAAVGPHRSPLGLSADPGGIPLYKAGTPVGGVGVISDALYSLDADISDSDIDNDVLSVSINDDELAWYENLDGLGSFGTQQVISTLNDAPVALTVADLDRQLDFYVRILGLKEHWRQGAAAFSATVAQGNKP